MSNEGPDGWPLVRLDHVAELSLGKMLDKEKNRGEPRPYLANMNVRWGGFDLQDLREMRFEEREFERYSLRLGDIVMCEGGEPGRCAIWTDTVPGMMIQKALHRIRPMEGIDNHYLYYALSHGARSGAFDEYMTGSGIKHLPGNQVEKLEVLMPPLDDQRRIAEVLRSVDEAIAAAERAVVQAEQTLNLNAEKLLVHNLADHASECRLVDLIASLDAGVSVNSEGRPAADGEIGILKTSCVSAGHFDPNENKVVRHDEVGRTRVQASGNSIIISRMNTLDLVGANAFVAEDCPNLYLPDRLWLLKTKPGVLCRWLAYYMKTARFRAQIIDIATGTSGSMKNISKGRLADIVLHVPDYSGQERAVAVLLAMESAMLSGRATLHSYRAMRQSLMSDLLTGHVRVPA